MLVPDCLRSHMCLTVCIVYGVYKMQSLNKIIQYLTVTVYTVYTYILQGIYTKPRTFGAI